MISYPTGKIYVGKDSVGSCRYFGSPNMDLVNADFQTLPREQQLGWDHENWSREYVSLSA